MTSTPASHPRSSRNRRWRRWLKSSAANSSSDKVRQSLCCEPITWAWLLRIVLAGYKRRKLQNGFFCVDFCGALVIWSLTAEIAGEDLLWSKYFLSGAAVDGQLRLLRFMAVTGVDVLSRFYVHVAKWIKVWTVMFCSLQSSKAPQIKRQSTEITCLFFFFFWFDAENNYAWFNTMYTFKPSGTSKVKSQCNRPKSDNMIRAVSLTL